MLRKMIYVQTGMSPKTDRDSYVNKRVHISGFLFALFRDLYFRYKNFVTHSANRYYKKNYGSSITSDQNIILNNLLIQKIMNVSLIQIL